jgi:uncharacterized repeat protein (TIGR01451 family)
MKATVATPISRRHRVGLLALLAAVIALGATLMPMTAGAVHNGPFELDGNAVADSDSIKDDWGTLFPTDSSTTDLGHSFVTDRGESGLDPDDGYGSGLTKDTQDVPNWSAVTGAISPEKDDILHAYAATYVDGTDQLLYFGQDRAPKPNGSTSMGFWFFQDQVAPDGSGGFTGEHRNGDVLITSDMTNGGSVSVVNIFRWENGGLVSKASLANAECGPSLPAAIEALGCAKANEDGPIDVPWPYPSVANPDEPVLQNIFFEGGINLSNLFPGQSIPCFSSFLANTRTSPSETADLKDFVTGTIDTCGTITIHKDATPKSARAFSFETTGEELSSFELADPTAGEDAAETKVFTGLEPGDYSVSEVDLPLDWANDDLTCEYSQGTSVETSGDDNGRTATITLSLAGNVECNYVNKRKPRVKLVKDLDPEDDPGRFDFALNGETLDNGGQGYGDGGTTGFVTVDPGEVMIAESAHEGTDADKYASSVECDSGKGDAEGTSLDFSIANGESVICEFSNDRKLGTLIVEKVVVNDDGGTKEAGDFKFSVNDDEPVAFEADGQNELIVDAGSYDVTEPAVAGYSTSYDNCDDIVVPDGGTATCTITNDDEPATLIVKKIVKLDDGGFAEARHFSFSVNGGEPVWFDGGEQYGEKELTVAAGNYTVTELPGRIAGYVASYEGCSEIVIPNGGTATCTITNDDQPGTLTVKKVVVNDDGGTKEADDFSFSVNGGEPVSFEADGDNVLSVDTDSAYTVTEPAVDGYETSYEGCSEIVIPNGGTATCTITNDDRPAKLVVKKVVVNDDGGKKAAADFSFAVNGGDAVPFEADGENELTVDAGSYEVTEPAVDGYETSYGGCDEIELANGDSATCTITNDDQPATLTVKKVVVNDDGGNKKADDFSFSVNGGEPVAFEADGDNVLGVDPGTYTVIEPAVDGYTTSYEGCEGIEISLGDSATCTITNDDKPATLIVEKVVVNDDGGKKTASDFSFKVNGDEPVSFEADGQNNLTVPAGTYTVTEPAVEGYATSYENCADVVIPNGGTATCTITNDDEPATLIVKKVVVNDEGGTKTASDFSFSVNGAEPASFEADGQNNLTVPAGSYSVTEPAVAGYTTSYEGCSEIVIPNGGTATCTITNNDDIAPSVDVTKDASVESIDEPGGDVIFTVNVWNTSHERVTLTSLVDSAYGNLDKDDVGNHSWVSSLCDTGATLAATDGTKGGADTYACTFVGAVRGEGPATHQNEVTAVVTDDENDTATDKDTATVAIKDVPPPPPPPPAAQIDLSVTKVDAPDPVRLNGEIGYTLLVRNAGPSTATGVTLADPLPAGTSFVSVSTTQGTCAFTGGLVQCNLGTIPAGGSVAVSLVVKATRAGVLDNEVTVVGQEPELDTTNNRARSTTLVLTPLLPPKPKPVCSTLTVGPKTLRVGKRSTITAAVKNRAKAVKGAKVVVRGAGITKSARTNARGKARITVRPSRPGIVIVSVPQKLACGAKRIGVVGVFEPPVTG